MPPYRELSQFAGNLATYLEAGLSLELSLKSSRRSFSTPRYRHAVEGAMDRIRAGADLSEALDSAGVRWPPFFLPILRAGEQSGRLDGSLRFLEHHCQLIDGPSRALRNTWLIPLAVLATGLALQFLLCLAFVSIGSAFGLLLDLLRDHMVLIWIGLIVVAPPLKPLVHALRLRMPVVGPIDRLLGVNRFFCIVAMLHATGGQRVEGMIRLATRAVPNWELRRDLLTAAAAIERGASIADAFQIPIHLTPDEKQTIAAADQAGTLERSLEHLSTAAGASLQFRLQLFQRIALRITMGVATMSVAFTIIRLLHLRAL